MGTSYEHPVPAQEDAHSSLCKLTNLNAMPSKSEQDSTLTPKNYSFQFATQMLTAFPIPTVQAPAGAHLLQLQLQMCKDSF